MKLCSLGLLAVESVYKTLAKVVASMLRKVVGKIVSSNQHAFAKFWMQL